MMQIEELEQQWTQLCKDRSPAKKYFDPSHALELLYGSDGLGRAIIALITTTQLDVQDLSRDVLVTRARRDDGKWAVTWSLHDPLLLPTFMRLGADIAARSARAATPEAALEALLMALTQWQMLLRPPPPKRLSLEQLRGLVAELWAGQAHIRGDRSYADLVQGWVGPKGGHQDYSFPSGEAWEVKAKRSSAHHVRVSSGEQLDPSGKQLRLAVLDLDERAHPQEGTKSLLDLVTNYRAQLSISPFERNLFDILLASLGVDLSDEYYAKTRFLLQKSVLYRVDEEFPCLRSSALPPNVEKVKYDLDIRHLDAWVIYEGGPDGDGLPE